MKKAIHITAATLALIAISVVSANAATFSTGTMLTVVLPIVTTGIFFTAVVLMVYFLSKASVQKKRAEYEALQKLSEINKEAVIAKFKNTAKTATNTNIYKSGITLAIVFAFVTLLTVDETKGTIIATILATVAGLFGYLNYKETINASKNNSNNDCNCDNN